MDITIIVLILLIIIITSIIVFLVISFYQHKDDNTTDFATEKKNRLDNINSVITQVNKTHTAMDDYNDTQFSIINTNIRANRDNIERTDTKFNNYTSNIDSIIKIRETFTSASNVVPSPALKKKDIDVLAQVNALGGVTIKDLDKDRSFQICGKTGECIKIPNSAGDTYFRAINSNASIILDSPVKAYADINFYKRGSTGALSASPAMWMKPSNGQLFAPTITGTTGRFDSATITSNLTVSGNLSAARGNSTMKNLNTTGNISIGSNLTVLGNLSATRGTTTLKNVNATGNIGIGSNLTVRRNLWAGSGTTTLKNLNTTGNIGIGYNLSVRGTLSAVTGDSRMRNLNTTGNIGIGSNLTVRRNLWAGSGTTTLKDVNATGNIGVGGYFRTKGGVSLENSARSMTLLPWAGDNRNYIRGDTEIRGRTNQMGDLNVYKKINFLTANGNDNTDPYFFQKVNVSPNVSKLQLNLNNEPDEVFEILSNGNIKHSFSAAGESVHTNKLVGTNICAGTGATPRAAIQSAQCLTSADITGLKSLLAQSRQTPATPPPTTSISR